MLCIKRLLHRRVSILPCLPTSSFDDCHDEVQGEFSKVIRSIEMSPSCFAT